ncbi:MAG: NAD(P)H-dependent oxidoreductase [Oleibacter sp.]|nr:NAD(P)H-dependent oxidoreductase [Thalassolituus sp.]
MAKVLIIYAHPAHQHSVVNRMLLDHIRDIPGVHIHDLYEAYPDFFIDVEVEQARLREYDAVVLQHPVYWYNMPSLLREWQDLVLEYGFAYGKSAKACALEGKPLWVVMTAGAPEHTYDEEGINQRPLSEYFYQYERMAQVCKMRHMPALEIFYSRRNPASVMEGVAQQYHQALTRLTEGLEIEGFGHG